MPHFYLKNIQGDVVGVTDAAGNIEARYTYDTWGKLVSITDENDIDRTTDTDFIGYINPIRYRGYYYDSETGLYYLNARYYDPETRRFINSDNNLNGGLNLFRYCYNNPVNMSDYNGKVPICIGGPMKKMSDGRSISYNCYGWAISRITNVLESIDPPGFQTRGGTRSVQTLSDSTMQGIINSGAQGEALGNLTDEDLNTVINNLSANQYLIAMRVDPKQGGDYHYMKFDQGGWTHKQGSGGLLFQLDNGVTPNQDDAWIAYLGDPDTGRAWLDENPITGEVCRTCRYTSETWYIKVTLIPQGGCCLIQ